jgi:hypothetical protein
MTKTLRYFIAIACISAVMVTQTAIAETIFVNKPASENDKRYDYPHQLLQMILDQTRTDYSDANVVPTEHVMTRDRMLRSLLYGEDLHVVAEAPKASWLEQLLVIRIPIRKGIQGYRLFFIDQSMQEEISKIDSFEEFMKLPTGSGAGWSTAEIMRQAGFDVIEGSSYDGLFFMLELGRFSTLGRGINEIHSELALQKGNHPNLAIEPKFALHIPLPTYFFVSPKKPVLAKRIEEGLWKLIQNGKFEELFLSHHLSIIESANLNNRTIFSIPNPNLSSADPIDKKELWYSF